MATVATPMGAEPVDTLSASGSFTGKVRHIKIANAYATAIFYGDFVKLVAAGTVEKAAVTTSVAAGTVGIFVGCAYTARQTCLLYTSPSPRDGLLSRMPSSA